MNELLKYKLDILRLEIETINQSILNKDEASRNLKTWAISIWTAATTITGIEYFFADGEKLTAFAIGNVNIPVTSLWALSTLAIPFAFSILEIYHRRIQRKFIWRARKIHAFLNDKGPSLTKAFTSKDFDNFYIYDPAGENWRRELGGDESKDFEHFIGFWTVLRIRNIYVFYSLLGLMSIVLSIIGTIGFN